jgi:hypothetical protein
MVHQPDVNGSSEKPANAVARNAFEFMGNVVTLGELQLKLLSLDLRDASQKALPLLGLAAAGVFLVGSSFTLLLAALGIALGQILPVWGALLVAGLVGLVVGGGSLALAARALSTRTAALDRSRVEFSKNLMWFKTALRGRPSRYQKEKSL